MAEQKIAKYSERDNKGKLCIDCCECTRGGNGSADDKCSSGWKIKKGRKGCCFIGTLLPSLYVPVAGGAA